MPSIYLKAEQPDVAAVVEEVWLQCFKANLDLRVTRNTGVVTNAAYPFDSPKKVVVGEVLNRIDGLSHPKIITDPRFSFADSALLFAFNSRLPAQIRK